MRSSMASRAGNRVSIALILSYVLDWIVIIIEAVIGIFFGNHTPNKRPFSLANPDISFPFTEHETISSALLIACGLLIPAVIIIIVVFIVVPGPTTPKTIPKSLIWRRKLWEWFAGWTGLALSTASAWLITNGMKNLFGHWRPDLLARCNPDVANIAKFAVGGIPTTAQGVSLVSWEICQTTDMSNLDDGFRSFPSGHASFSSAGLVYLSLFLAAKLSFTIPFLAPRLFSADTSLTAFPSRSEVASSSSSAALTNLPHSNTDTAYHATTTTAANKSASADLGNYNLVSPPASPTSPSFPHHHPIPARTQAATPPLYLLAFVVVPFLVAIYITSTRYAEFRHHGFDLLFGFFIGTTTAIFSFSLYQLPLERGAGWAWGPRSAGRAFWAGVGVGGYVVGGLEKVLVPRGMGGEESKNGNGILAGGGANGDVEAGPSGRDE